MNAKQSAAEAAVRYVQSGMTLGIGTGSTAQYAIEAIGRRVREERLIVRGVPTSERSRELALENGIPLVEAHELDAVDLTIDGADEVDPSLDLIKGGGGALVREKIVAAMSRRMVVICDGSKPCAVLGAFPLPVAVMPFGWEVTRRRVEAVLGPAHLRMRSPGALEPFVTDDGLFVLDVRAGAIPNPAETEEEVKRITGVAEVGLFVGLATSALVGRDGGHVEELLPRRAAVPSA
ncbi:MAG: ribose-5-phosphate isomerase RpiA [Armatimonadetes bacterium]|nr:ribose-5-phosphate isomerase RpiA [Armatimonadota bacterium]MDE2206232.1 ribose-5-phosphate isomerase RpiA [Armatimonadota bacterium]